jgi:RNase P subunit RPR2
MNIEKEASMPAKMLPDKERFELFTQYMLTEGFRKLSSVEFSSSYARLGLQAPRPREGRETGFVFTANGLTVFVWTTFLENEGHARDEDSGWVLITEGDRPAYFCHPMMRTEGFLRRLYRNAKIAKERVMKRPICPSCRAFMEIAMGKGLKSRYWKCVGKSRPHYVKTLPWDCNLCDESATISRAERKERKPYRKLIKDSGKKVVPAMLVRKPWPRKPWQRTRLEDRT